MDKLDSYDKLIKLLPPSKIHLFVGGDLVASEKSIKLLKDFVKENYDPPKKNIKGYIVRIFTDKKLHIEITQVSITPKLFIGAKDDDAFQTFTYTKNELLKYGFKINQIKSMIKAIQNNTISFEKSSISISELLKDKV
tara:strand:- start:570 stop:983 length:414 start_codon:yes stop_codon:yes gene_type:complete